MKLVTVAQMQELEQQAAAGGLSVAQMMENAGQAVANALAARFDLMGCKVLVLVGPGHNGGDGLVAARRIHGFQADVTAYLFNRTGDDNDDVLRAAQAAAVTLVHAEEDTGWVQLRRLAGAADFVLDALLGTGVTRPVEGQLADLLNTVRSVLEARQASRPAVLIELAGLPAMREPLPQVVAVDLPSGVNADSGQADPATLPAGLTVTFGYPKIGLFRFPAASYTGELIVADIALPAELGAKLPVDVATADSVAKLLPTRPNDAHKGTFGKVLVIAGSVNYIGAAYLAGSAAARVGAGLVMMGVASAIYPILAATLHEAVWLLLPNDMGVLSPDATKPVLEKINDYKAVLVGPGLSGEKPTVEFVQNLLAPQPTQARRIRMGFGAARDEAPTAKSDEERKLPPLVIDADGLNALAKLENWHKFLPAGCILTPHVAEMARLCRCQPGDLDDRIEVAKTRAAEWNQILVLKGAYTIVAAPDGRITVIPFANSAMATAGTGDVLSGTIVGLLGQGLDSYSAALVGAYLHGLCGQLMRAEYGSAGGLAGDLLLYLPEALSRLRGE